MPPRKSTNEQSSIASTSSADKSFSSDSLASKSSNSSASTSASNSTHKTGKSVSKPLSDTSKPSGAFLNLQKSADILNYYAISLGVGGYSNLSSSFTKSSTIRQAHSNFLNWLIANNIVSLNLDMVQYISAFLEDFPN